MLDWILVDVIEPGKIRVLMCEASFPEIVPNFAAGCSIQAIDPFRRFFMQEA
jgi:hypothetical protein